MFLHKGRFPSPQASFGFTYWKSQVNVVEMTHGKCIRQTVYQELEKPMTTNTNSKIKFPVEDCLSAGFPTTIMPKQ